MKLNINRRVYSGKEEIRISKIILIFFANINKKC